MIETKDSPAVQKPKMTARDVNVFYGQKQAINNVSIAVRMENVTAFIGPSACGKSTFLRPLNRCNDTVSIPPVEGEITLDTETIYASSMEVVQLPPRLGIVFKQSKPYTTSIYSNF